MTLVNYLKTHQKTHLIFDFDETLVHVLLPWDRWEEDIKDELIKIDKSIYSKYKRRRINLSQLENAYISKYPQTKDLIIKNSVNFETKYLKEVVPNKKLISFIKYAGDYKKFIWSSNSIQIIEKGLKKFKIEGKFQKISSRTNLTLIKPETEGFEKIYAPNIPKKNYLFIGNSSYDRLAAKKSDINFYLEDYFK